MTSADHTRAAGSGILGRVAELVFLRAALRDAADAVPRLVVISGEPGIGKTRLAREVLQDAAARGFDVRIARCLDGDRTPPGTLTSSLLGHAGTDPAIDDDVPAAAAAIVGRSDTTPVAVLVDDAQWADEASFSLLHSLADAFDTEAGARLMVLLTVRTGTEAPNAAVEALQRRPSCLTVVPEPLDTFDTRELLLRHGVDLTTQQAEEIRQATRGNPLLIDMAAGTLANRAGSFDAIDLAALGDLTGATRARLSELPSPTRAVLEVLAVAGDASRSDLAGVAGVGPAVLDDLLRPGVDLGVAELGHTVDVAISHPLFADALVAAIDGARRRELHAAWFGLLHSLDDPASLARRANHALGAGDLVPADQAVAVLLPAGRQAYAAQAMSATVRFLGEGLALATSLGDRWTMSSRDEAILRQELGEAQVRTLHTEGGIANLEKAAAAFAAIGDRAARARTLVDLLSAQVTSNPVGQHIGLEEPSALAVELEAIDPVAAAWLWTELASVSTALVQFKQAEELANRAIAFSADGVNVRAAVRAHATIGVVRWNQHRVADAAAEFARGGSLVGPDDVKWHLEPRLRELLSRAWMGEFERVRADLDRVYRLSADSGYWKENSFAQLARALLEHSSGNLVDAASVLARSRRDVELSDYRSTTLLILPFQVGVLTELGRTEEAGRVLAEWQASQTETSPVYVAARLAAVWMNVVSGTIATLDDENEAAVREGAALGSFRFLGSEALAAGVIDIAFHLDRPDLVGDVPTSIERAIAGGMAVSSGVPFVLAQARARARWLLGDREDAAAALSELADRDGGTRRMPALLALADLVLLDERAGHHDLARRESLRSRAEAVGAWRLVQRTEGGAAGRDGDDTRFAICVRLDGDQATLLDAEHRVRGIVTAAGGRASGRSNAGGGIIGWFDDGRSALSAATDCVVGVDRHSPRVGVAAGELIERDDNAYGEAVNLAARLCAIATPGSARVCDTTVVTTQAVGFVDLGAHQLRGISRPLRVHEWSPGAER